MLKKDYFSFRCIYGTRMLQQQQFKINEFRQEKSIQADVGYCHEFNKLTN